MVDEIDKEEVEEEEEFNLGIDFSKPKFDRLYGLPDWIKYLLEEFSEIFKKNSYVTKAMAFLLRRYYTQNTGKVSLEMPEIKVEAILTGKYESEAKANKLFNAVKQLKDSKIVERKKTMRHKSLMEMRISYSDIASSIIKLKPRALILILEFPEEFRELAGEAKDQDDYEYDRYGYRRNKYDNYNSPKVGIMKTPQKELDECILSSINDSEIKGFINSILNREKLLIWGIKYTPKLLLGGYIGTGKSISAEAIAQALEMDLYSVSAENVVGSYLGETAQNVSLMFKFAKQYQDKCILFIDEIEGILGKRGYRGGAEKDVSRAINTFLTQMEESNNLIIIGASNHIHQVDKAGLSRFSKIVWFDLPTKEMLVDIIKIHFQNLPIAKEIDIEEIAEACYDLKYAGRDIRNLTIEIAQEMLANNKEELTNEIMDICLKRLRARNFQEKSMEYAKVLNGDQDNILGLPKEVMEKILNPEEEAETKTEKPKEKTQPVTTETGPISTTNLLELASDSDNIPKDQEAKTEKPQISSSELERDDLVRFYHFGVQRKGIIKDIKRKKVVIEYKTKKGELKETLKLKIEIEIIAKAEDFPREKLLEML